jgi:hypothetical protein
MTDDAEHRAAAAGPPGRDEDEDGMLLEPGQFAADRQRPVPRAALSARATAALWVLRIFVIVLSALVIYAFIAELG